MFCHNSSCVIVGWQKYTPWIVPRVSGHPHSAQEFTKMRSLHWRGRETKKWFFLSSSRLCLMGWGSSSLEILMVCSWADQGSSQLGTPGAKRCCRDFLELYRVYTVYQFGEQDWWDLIIILLNKNEVNQKHYQFLPAQAPTAIPSRFFRVNS